MASIIQLRRDTSTNWSNTNPVLSSGEIGIATDLNQFKIGNGTSTWSQLSYVNALPSGKLSQFASTNSSELANVISDETGYGSLVFANTPTLITPVLGVASATSINKVSITEPATSATLTIADGKTLTASNTLTFTGTDSSSVSFGAGGTVAYTSNKLNSFASTSSSELATVISDETGSGALVFATSPTLVTPNIGVASGTSLQTTGDITVGGNLIVNGTTTTVNSTTVTVDDPIFTLGGDSAPASDDNRDRGIEFRWHDGASAKLGFFGFDDSTGKLTFIPDATNTSEVFSGTKGEIDATVDWSNISNKPDPVITLGGDLSGSVTLTDLASGTLTATIAANSVELGTDTTGNYVNDITAGSYIIKTGTAGEGWSPSIAVDATDANTASKVVARDASGNFSAGTITASLTGTASLATNFDVEADDTTNATHYLVFVGGATGSQRPNSDTDLYYNPSTNTLTAGVISGTTGTFSGNVTAADPTLSTHVATKNYVDANSAGLSPFLLMGA